MTQNIIVRELARHAMDYANKKCWGLGEVGFELNKWALDEVEECDGFVGWDDAFDSKNSNCSGDHEAHLKKAKKLASEARELAFKLDDLGVSSFN